jgi:endonuclease/exonuclease/phosphatase family metal-dependent hydrolase
VLVRTWNLFHGNTHPPQRRGFLHEMVELVTADRPDVVCLQELPVWALQELESWSGMRAVGEVARRPRLGSAALGRVVTDLHHGVLRSALTGEADAILVDRARGIAGARAQVVSASGLRRIVHGVAVDGVFVANCHTQGEDQLRAAAAFAAAAERAILAGDVNLRPPYALDGWSEPLAGSIDQILVRGLPATAPVAWPEERRRVDAGVLSDHAPVELTLA